jgi:nucleotide-binding universal stress UspA family protein
MPADGLVVAAFDGLPDSDPALRVAVDEARLRHARLLVVSAWHAPNRYYGSSAAPSASLRLAHDLRVELSRRLNDATARLREEAPELEIDARLVEGPAADVLANQAAGAELLVVGSRGLRGFRELLLGSTSHRCVQRAPCPVLIVPSHGAESAHGEERRNGGHSHP